MTNFPGDEPVRPIAQPDMFGAPDVGGERDDFDRYFTPPWATLALMNYLGGRLRGTIWEPCAGQCHIANVLRDAGHSVVATDINPHESLDDGAHNFLHDEAEIVTDSRPNWIVSNPPYRWGPYTATDFVRHALEIAVDGVAMLLRLSWLEPCEERVDLFRSDPPKDLLILPRVHYLGAPGSNNQTSVWCIWEGERARQPVVVWRSAEECRQWGRK